MLQLLTDMHGCEMTPTLPCLQGKQVLLYTGTHAVVESALVVKYRVTQEAQSFSAVMHVGFGLQSCCAHGNGCIPDC